ncbi:hypothetical protein BDB01DRAFT_905374 [Pilobolus umbonatus]|nr:hypothetical protein BDB01DRAFT_905374 [Pilobolus umbonatus]
MKSIITSALLLVLNASYTLAATAPARHSSQCTFLVNKIFCFSGIAGGNILLSDMIALNVHAKNEMSATELTNGWDTITPKNPVKGRILGQGIHDAKRTKLYLEGGVDANNSPLADSFVVYDAAINSWSTFPDYKIGNISGSIYNGTVAVIPSTNKLAFYGGSTALSGAVLPISIDGTMVSPVGVMPHQHYPFGFNNLTLFDVGTQKWEHVSTATGFGKDFFVEALHSVSVPHSQMIYYLGGIHTPKMNPPKHGVKKTQVDFNTINGLSVHNYALTSFKCTGEIPTQRDHQTVTLLPDNNTVMMFGGSKDSRMPLPDNCHLLDLNSKVWRRCGLTLPNTIKPSRFKHSAVLVNNHVFIMFGTEDGSTPLTDMIILDVSNVKQIKHVEQYKNTLSPSQPKQNGKGWGWKKSKSESDVLYVTMVQYAVVLVVLSFLAV